MRERRADYIESLAMAYYSSGNIDKAQAEYEKIISASVNRLAYVDCYAQSFYELGKLYEQKGCKSNKEAGAPKP